MESTFLEHDLSSYFFLVLLPNCDKLGAAWRQQSGGDLGILFLVFLTHIWSFCICNCFECHLLFFGRIIWSAEDDKANQLDSQELGFLPKTNPLAVEVRERKDWIKPCFFLVILSRLSVGWPMSHSTAPHCVRHASPTRGCHCLHQASCPPRAAFPTMQVAAMV